MSEDELLKAEKATSEMSRSAFDGASEGEGGGVMQGNLVMLAGGEVVKSFLTLSEQRRVEARESKSVVVRLPFPSFLLGYISPCPSYG